MSKFLALLLFILTLVLPSQLFVQSFPPLSLAGVEIPGNGVDDDNDDIIDEVPATSIVEDSTATGNYHFHFKDCEKIVFENVADVTFPDNVRVEKPAGTDKSVGEMICYIPNLPANTYTSHILSSSPGGPKPVWFGINKPMRYNMKVETASYLAARDTLQWQQLIYTGTAENFYKETNGGDQVQFVWPGGAFALVFRGDDARYACGYLSIGATPVLSCPGEPQTPIVVDYNFFEIGPVSPPATYNDPLFTYASEMQLTGTETGTICGGVLTVKGLWQNTTTDRRFFSIICNDTSAIILNTANDFAPTSSEDQFDFRGRYDLLQILDTDTYQLIANLQPVYSDADWSGAGNTRNYAISLNTTVVRNVSGSSWNMFIASDLGQNIIPDTIGLCQAILTDRDADATTSYKYFKGTSTSISQWGKCKYSSTVVPAPPGDTTPPSVTSPNIPIGSVEQTSFVMTANTNEAGLCQILSGTTTGNYNRPPSVGSQSVGGVCTESLTGLVAGQIYYAVMRVTPPTGPSGNSPEDSVTTDSPPAGCTHYASQTGTGDGSTEAKAFKIVNFVGASGVATPGKTLCLIDGTYTGSDSMIIPRANLSGNNLAKITIKAINDGKVFINGQTARKPIHLANNNDWWIIQGINVANSGPLNVVAPVVHVQTDSANNTFQRICAWNAPPDTNSSIWHISSGPGNIVEDSCAFGGGRKGFTNSKGGDDIRIRRSFGIWMSHSYVGPKMPFSNVYDSYGAIYENNIAMWNGTAPDQAYGCYGQDGITTGAANTETNSKYLASLCLLRSTDTVNSSLLGTLMGARTSDNTEFRDMITYVDPGSHTAVQPILGQIFDIQTGSNQCSATPDGVCNRQFNNITKIGFTKLQSINSATWTTSNIRTYANIKDMNDAGHNPFQATGTTGARMCLRTVNGQLTSEKLWPWPMNQRIIDAMTLAGKTPAIDVTALVESKFGTIPAACKS